MNDSISDFIIRLKNASFANNEEVMSPHSKLRENMAKLLSTRNLIAGYQVETNEANGFKYLIIKLTKTKAKVNRLEAVIVSKPGRRVYSHASKLAKHNLGRSTLVVSTPKGLMTADQAIKENLGGELICRVGFK